MLNLGARCWSTIDQLPLGKAFADLYWSALAWPLTSLWRIEMNYEWHHSRIYGKSKYHFWIIDSNANRHMRGSNKSLFNYTTCPSKDSVRIVDGFLTSVYGTSSVVCTSNITLPSVLHIPKFLVNFLSVSTITKALNCKLEFFLGHCVFQDLQTGNKVGRGRLCEGLYLLDRSPSMSQALFGDNRYVNQE